jgi:hypothetical protein
VTAVPQPAGAGSDLVARPAGVARSGRDRRHQSPRRRRTVAAAFTDAEYAALDELRRAGVIADPKPTIRQRPRVEIKYSAPAALLNHWG